MLRDPDASVIEDVEFSITLVRRYDLACLLLSVYCAALRLVDSKEPALRRRRCRCW